jgi:hypothetical protein
MTLVYPTEKMLSITIYALSCRDIPTVLACRASRLVCLVPCRQSPLESLCRARFLVGNRSLSVVGLCWFVSAKFFDRQFLGKKITPAPVGARAILDWLGIYSNL